MADDLTSLQAQLADLRAAYRSGADSVSYEGGKSTRFRSGEEMRAAIASLEAEIAAMQGTTKQTPRSVLVRSTKGW